MSGGKFPRVFSDSDPRNPFFGGVSDEGGCILPIIIAAAAVVCIIAVGTELVLLALGAR